MDDRQLLQEYREHQSEKAFAELVARHVRLVYATALRLTGERQAAEDVVQAVFLLLARKSWMVRDGNALPGWLYRATQRTAFNELRKEQRRRQRETEAMNNAELDAGTQAMLAKLLPLLDEALSQLSSVEQNLIILRFFENKSLRETGATAALSEQATHNRITRAVEKLRQYFARAGVTVVSGSVVTALTAPSSQAVPVGLAAKVTGAALAGSGAALGMGDVVLKFFLTMNTKTQVALAMVVIGLIALPFLRSADVSENAPPVVNNSSVVQPTDPVVTSQIVAAQAPMVAQPVQPATQAVVVATNQSFPGFAQAGQGGGPLVPSVPIGGQVVAQTEDGSPRRIVGAQLPNAPAANRLLSHNVALRITGTLGAGQPIDITLLGVQALNRDIMFGSGNVTGSEGQPLAANFAADVSLANNGYQVDYSVTLWERAARGAKSSSVKRSAIMQPGETTTGASADGQVKVKVTLTEVAEASPPVAAQASPGQNLIVRMRGALAPEIPIDVKLISAVHEQGDESTGITERHQINTDTRPDGEVQPLEEMIHLARPDPNANADPDSYLVSYSLSYRPPPITSTNSSGQLMLRLAGEHDSYGFVLLKLGQTVTVSDYQGQGSIQLSLTTDNS